MRRYYHYSTRKLDCMLYKSLQEEIVVREEQECLDGWLEDNYLWAKQNGAIW